MSGILVNPADGGVAPSLANHGYAPTNAPASGSVDYYPSGCGAVLRDEVLNSLISEILSTVDLAGLDYDPASLTNLNTAINAYISRTASLTSATTLTASRAGTFFEMNGSTAFTTTLYAAAATPGAKLIFANQSTVSQTLAVVGGASFHGPVFGGGTAITMPAGSTLCLISDGSVWQVAFYQSGGVKGMAVFGAAGTYSWTCPNGTSTVKETVTGAGAGGAGGTSGVGGGNGGAGGTAIGLAPVTPGTSYTIIVGNGGGGGAAGNNSGSNGTSSSGLGLSATGGLSGNNNGSVGSGGGGGVGSGGTVILAGGFGSDGCGGGVSAQGGLGGSSYWGGGGRAAIGYDASVQNGRAPGSGGGAGYGSTTAGGRGQDGVVLLEY
jgi:hypothetical protein